MERWFTADTHAWHQNIIAYCDRPWSTAEQMTDDMAVNINACIPANAILYHLGDFSWGNKLLVEKFRSMINCKHIVLVLGNHDKIIRQDKNARRLFTSVNEILEINTSNRHKIVMCHYAMRVWNASFHGAWQLYGHSHGTLPDDPRALSCDVGVDCWDYKPISLDTIQETMRRKTCNDEDS